MTVIVVADEDSGVEMSNHRTENGKFKKIIFIY